MAALSDFLIEIFDEFPLGRNQIKELSLNE